MDPISGLSSRLSRVTISSISLSVKSSEVNMTDLLDSLRSTTAREVYTGDSNSEVEKPMTPRSNPALKSHQIL
jgi:hypothetical protein